MIRSRLLLVFACSGLAAALTFGTAPALFADGPFEFSEGARGDFVVTVDERYALHRPRTEFHNRAGKVRRHAKRVPPIKVDSVPKPAAILHGSLVMQGLVLRRAQRHHRS